MIRLLLQRFVTFLPTLVGISILVFFVIRQIPGDAISARLGAEAAGSLTPAQEAAYRAYFGLDKPLTQQYLEWAGKLLQGDFGQSDVRREPALDAILRAFPLTLELTLLSLLIALLLGLPVGVFSALRPNTRADLLMRTLSLLGLSFPGFWLGSLLILGLSLGFHLMPNAGRYVPFNENPIQNLSQMILPALTLGFGFSASVMRTTRSSLSEILSQDYVRTAYAKGLRERVVIRRHALRNGLLPIITLVGIEMGYLLGGAVLIEEVFALPGLGRLTYTAILQRDYALAQGAVLFIAFNFVVINLLADFLYGLVDPRLRRA
jgi:peptide/nickel transport system permease protein